MQTSPSSSEPGVGKTLFFVVLGDVVPQGRPRLSMAGGHPHAYDPPKSRDYKRLVREEALKTMNGTPPLTGALSVSVGIGRGVPASWSKREHQRALDEKVRPTSRPDLDNLVKGIKDACNGVVWKDDAQVVKLSAVKFYTDRPHAWVRVEEMPFC